MTHTCLGIDIGSGAVRLAALKDGAVQRLAALDIPDKEPQAREILPEDVAQALRALLRKERIFARHCALVLPLQTAFVRHVSLPWMTEKQLKLNLPYEFQDYINGNPDKFFFDYIYVGQKTGEDGAPVQMDLLAAVTAKETIAQYRAALRRAGLTLSAAVPEYLTYRNLIRAYEAENPLGHPAEYCIIDMGSSTTRVHMYRGAVYETTQVIEHGSRRLTRVLEESPQKSDGTPDDELLCELCGTIAIEILRSINFYGFNTPGSDLRDVYLTSGITSHAALTEVIRETIRLRIHTLDELFPAIGKERRFGAAIGAALEFLGR